MLYSKKSLVLAGIISLVGGLSLTGCDFIENLLNSANNVTNDTATNEENKETNNNPSTFTVFWKNYDGTILEVDNNVTEGSMPSYDGSTPIRENSQSYSYTFIGWSPEVTKVYSDVTYTAEYYGNPLKTLTNIEVSGDYQTAYHIGDTFNPDGIVVTAHYNDGSSEVVTSQCTFEGFDSSEEGEILITVKYSEDISETIIITILPNETIRELTGIDVSGSYQTVYYVGDTFNPEGIVVTAHYSDNTNEEVTSFCEIEGFDSSVEGEIEITIAYGDFTETIQLTILPIEPIKELSYIEVSGSYRIIYYVGDEFDPTGIIVTAYYSDGSSEDVSEHCTFEGFNSSTEGCVSLHAVYQNIRTTIYLSIIDNISPDYVYYGSYPQSVVTDESLISSLDALSTTNSKGYFEYGGEQYEKVYAKPFGSNYTFNNGAIIQSDTYYYFKVEPIQLKCLSDDGVTAFLTSEYLLDAHRYNEYYSGQNDQEYYANNYKNSEIRNWLNNDFLDKAFDDDSMIATTPLDNSVASTGESSNQYVCETTYDKIFLLSRKEITNSDYGFATCADRYCKPTDYARARGGFMETYEDYYGNGYYWTRSPGSQGPYRVLGVETQGFIFSIDYFGFVDPTLVGVRPSLSLNIA